MSKWRPYLQRATELAQHQPVVAHYCRMHAVELMMQARKAGDTSQELEKQLLEELQRAEASKKSPEPHWSGGSSHHGEFRPESL